MLLGGTLCQLMEQTRHKTVNPLANYFLSLFVLVITCLPNVSNKKNHDNGENQWPTDHIGGLVIIILFQGMDKLRPK